MNWKSFLAGAVAVLIVIVIGVTAFYFGKQTSVPKTSPSSSPTPSGQPSKQTMTPSPTRSPKAKPTASLLSPTARPTPSLTPTPTPKKKIKAGGAVSFPVYTAAVPAGWRVSQEHDDLSDFDRLTLKKDGYEIGISQGATGGALCLYPGDPDSGGPSSTSTTYVTINGQHGLILRRSGGVGDTGYTICEKWPDGQFGLPTSFGHINYVVPAGASEAVLAAMDLIVASLTKQ